MGQVITAGRSRCGCMWMWGPGRQDTRHKTCGTSDCTHAPPLRPAIKRHGPYRGYTIIEKRVYDYGYVFDAVECWCECACGWVDPHKSYSRKEAMRLWGEHLRGTYVPEDDPNPSNTPVPLEPFTPDIDGDW